MSFGGGGGGNANAQLEEQRAETARMREEATAERRELSESAAAARRARMRGGRRALLSEARLSPEEGVGRATLGSSGMGQ